MQPLTANSRGPQKYHGHRATVPTAGHVPQRHGGTPHAQYRISNSGCGRRGRFRPNAPLLPESAPQGRVDASPVCTRSLTAAGPLSWAIWEARATRDPGMVCAGVVALFTSAGGYPAPIAQGANHLAGETDPSGYFFLALFALRGCQPFILIDVFLRAEPKSICELFPITSSWDVSAFFFLAKNRFTGPFLGESRSLMLLWARKTGGVRRGEVTS